MKNFPDKLICVPVTETSADDFLRTLREAGRSAEAVELRLDYLNPNNLEKVLRSLPDEIGSIEKPVIMTFRPREQGGMRDLSLQERREFWQSLPMEIIDRLDFADFELDLALSLINDTPPIPWAKVICSWHDFGGTPAELTEIFERINQTPAAVIKIATKANRIADCLPLLELLEKRERGRPLIILGMGMAGIMTRILSLSRGAWLTFGALRRGAESAPGQPTVEELINLYRVKELDRESRIYGVMGNPVGHSRSPRMHNRAFKASGLDAVYLPFEVDDAGDFIRDFVRPSTRRIDWRICGLSVTIPHKVAIMPHLDEIDDAARRIGAVNTILVDDGRLVGFNTDVTGAMKPLEKIMDVRGLDVAVLGAGGAARAICYGLAERGAVTTVYCRDPLRGRSLADDFGATARMIEEFEGQADVLINCTPIGMSGHSEGLSPVGGDSLKGVKLVYDLVYNPEETALLTAARNAGCQTLGGLEMLIGQAAEQFRIWTGREAPLNAMRLSALTPSL